MTMLLSAVSMTYMLPPAKPCGVAPWHTQGVRAMLVHPLCQPWARGSAPVPTWCWSWNGQGESAAGSGAGRKGLALLAAQCLGWIKCMSWNPTLLLRLEIVSLLLHHSPSSGSKVSMLKRRAKTLCLCSANCLFSAGIMTTWNWNCRCWIIFMLL